MPPRKNPSSRKGRGSPGLRRRAFVLDRRLLWVLAAVAALRLALWWNRQGPLWFEEDIPLQATFALRGWQGGRFDLDPHYTVWPHLAFYCFLAVQLLDYFGGRMLGSYTSLPDFRAAAVLDPNHLRAAAMLAAIAVSLATLWAAHRLARRWLGPSGALAVVLGLGLDPLFLRYSLAIAPDMLLTFFVLLGLDAAREVETRGRLRHSLAGGLWMGLGAASKYSPALLAAPLLWAHARRPGAARGWRAWLDPRLAGCFAVAVAAFAAASPYTVARLFRVGGELGVGAKVLGGGGAAGAWRPSFPTYALDTLPADLGWPLGIGLLASLAWVLLRRAREHAVLLAFVLAYGAVFAALPIAVPHYLLPLLAPLFVVAVVAFQAAWAQPRLRAGAALAAAAAAGGLLVQCVSFLMVHFRADSRALAADWMVSSVPDRALVALESLGPDPPHRFEYNNAARPPAVSPERRARLGRGPAYWTHEIPFVALAPEATAEFYDPRLYVDFDYVLTSGGVRGRFLRDSTRYRVQADFYRALDEFFELTYRSPPGAVGPEMRVYRPRPDQGPALANWWASRDVTLPASGSAWTPRRRAYAFASRAQLLLIGGRHAAASRDWRRALEWPGAPTEWWFQYATSARQAGDWEGARAGYAAAFSRDEKLVEAGLGWAGAAARLKRREESLNLLRSLLARPDLDETQRTRAEYLLRLLQRGGGEGGEPGRP